ncbi:aminodeoxychorismate synthase component I [Streptomyces noursei]|uniref:aminodeoxychorismate synthase component I n=1 Tax=Streptomyces noursei TaxID=1971 RepID=UPI001679DCD5|nr:aminodeoxychorismate synthase component I [Streptomyces noursei]MCZ1016383.1 aminodeoxychorismate synthase component I [Streptomyces noursei]GGX00093.1 aminodeoxychorismate synthase, component I [Streptomyces noursei]
MRTLIVDNYDSFTYNLFHSLARVNGEDPVVVRNDDPSWRLGRLAEFDNVVLSPGPGSPAHAADFGICRELVDRCDLPLLGVCLGYQGIALQHGATVGRAPEPRHGRTSPVLHDGTGLFEGLPQPFEAVRYHSLAVSALPEELVATAWTPDGILMGLRHRDRPLWGVQFHPESVATQYGQELLANFRDLSLTRGARRDRPVPVSPSAAMFTGLSAPAPPGPARRLRVLVEDLPTRWDEEAAFDALFRGSEHTFWLDSSRRDPSLGRFSFMGDAAGPLARVATADVHDRTVTVRSAAGTQVVTGEFLEWLDVDLRGVRTELPDLPFEFALGWVGYLGYELKAECGGARAHRSEEPDAAMIFTDRALVLDHLTGTTYLLALVEEGGEGAGYSDETARAWFADAAEALDAIAGVVPHRPNLPAPLSPIRLRHDRETYLDLIERCQQEITAGETYEVCLTNMAEADGDLDPWQSYRFLRRTSPAPFGALLRLGQLSVLSTSPERFLRVSRDGTAESKPIKGTRPRGAGPREDAALVAALRTSEKDRAENLMIVDLVRNDLGQCAEVGSVEVTGLFDVESYATVHQLVSTVRARLAAGRSAVECVRAAFPGGSMTGAPKIRTMEIVDRLEAGPRGVYSGAIGYFSLSGAADLSIVIRTAVVTPGRVRYGVGGAIVALSDPTAEYEETAVKAAPLLALAQGSFPGRAEIAEIGSALCAATAATE